VSSAGRVLPAVAVATLLCLFGAQTQASSADDALIGLWASRTVAPSLAGPLTLTRKGSGWRARLAGARRDFTVQGGDVRFDFPGGAGGFRGAIEGHDIRGFWIQRFGIGEGGDQTFASPLVLRARRPGVWQGVVRPLKDSFTLFARIDRGADGRLVGAIRNPERNPTGGASQYAVSRQGDGVLFGAVAGGTTPKAPLEATLLHAPDRLRIVWPDLGSPVELVRQTPTEAADFFPRPPGAAPYVYRRPPRIGDGWETARARDAGMDEAALEQLVRRLIAIDPAARRPPLIHSLLVARHGKLVLEEYFHGFDRAEPHDMRSAAKTFVSIMLGAAMRDGAPISPESRVYDVLAGLGPFANPDPRKAQITLAQLLTHSSGLACDDNDDASPGAEDAVQSQKGQPNWLKFTLDLPMAHDPGALYAYCSPGINLAGGALAASTHTWLPALFDRTIARPLQFGPYFWDLAPDGEGYGGGGVYLRPRDLLKLGQTYLDGGVWHGRRIVGADWVKTSTAPRVDISPASTGLDAEHFRNAYFAGQDGYAWHLGTFHIGGRDYAQYAATGNGGQLLIVVPAFDLVVVFTAGNYNQGGVWYRFRSEIVPNEIIPAITR